MKIYVMKSLGDSDYYWDEFRCQRPYNSLNVMFTDMYGSGYYALADETGYEIEEIDKMSEEEKDELRDKVGYKYTSWFLEDLLLEKVKGENCGSYINYEWRGLEFDVVDDDNDEYIDRLYT